MPFGYVHESLLEAEYQRRVKAERVADEQVVTIGERRVEIRRLQAELTSARALATSLASRIADALATKEDFKQMYHDAMQHTKDMLEHVLPLAPEVTEQPQGERRLPTAAEIMSEPASTKRELFVRAQRAAAARQRETQETRDAAQQRQQDLMSDDEKRAMQPDAPFDHTLGVFTDSKPKAEGDALNDSP